MSLGCTREIIQRRIAQGVKRLRVHLGGAATRLSPVVLMALASPGRVTVSTPLLEGCVQAALSGSSATSSIATLARHVMRIAMYKKAAVLTAMAATLGLVTVASALHLSDDGLSPPRWQGCWGGPGQDVSLGVGADSSGHMYFLCRSDGEFEDIPPLDGDGRPSSIIGQVDAHGKLKWKQRLDQRANAMTTDASGCCYVVTHAHLFKFSKLGEAVWRRPVDLGDRKCFARTTDVCQAADGEAVFVCGVSKRTGLQFGDQAFISKYDAAGRRAWTRFFGNGVRPSAFAKGVCVTSGCDGKVLVAAHQGRSADVVGRHTVHVRMYADDGADIWQASRSANGLHAVALTSTGEGIVFDSDGLAAWSDSGAELWQRSFSDLSLGRSTHADLVAMNDGSLLLVSCRTGKADKDDGSMMLESVCISREGRVVHRSMLASLRLQAATPLIACMSGDGDLVVAGTTVKRKGDVFISTFDPMTGDN